MSGDNWTLFFGALIVVIVVGYIVRDWKRKGSP